MSYHKSGEAAQRHHMHFAFGVVLRLLHASVAILAYIKRLLGAGFEKALFVFHVERDAPLGRAITQKAPHRVSPAASLIIRVLPQYE
jgi:hypothetical protein